LRRKRTSKGLKRSSSRNSFPPPPRLLKRKDVEQVATISSKTLDIEEFKKFIKYEEEGNKDLRNFMLLNCSELSDGMLTLEEQDPSPTLLQPSRRSLTSQRTLSLLMDTGGEPTYKTPSQVLEWGFEECWKRNLKWWLLMSLEPPNSATSAMDSWLIMWPIK
jgi:hypothetical protein